MIPNFIDVDCAAGRVALSRQNNPYLPASMRFGPATGRYNCRGLVFAGRRTNVGHIDVPVDIDKLLLRDRFE